MTLPALAPAGSRPFDFVAVGESSLDLICVCSTLPEPDSKTTLQRKMSLPGGQAATAAVGVSRLGFKSRYVGAIGDDASGQAIRAALDRDSVDASHIITRHGVETRSAIIVVDDAGRRTVMASRDARLDINDDEVDSAVFANSRVLLVDGSDMNLAQRAARTARAAGVRTLVDLDTPTDDSMALLRHIDAVIVPLQFVHAATGRADIGEGLMALSTTSGAPVVIATAGANGAIAWTMGRVHEVNAEPVHVVDTTGAGDAFRAGFAACWLAAPDGRLDLIDALRFAARVAAMNCLQFGAQAGLPTARELGWSGEGRV